MRRRLPSPAPRASRVALVAGLALGVALAGAGASRAASQLLESVKQNPALAQELCNRFKALNAQGKSATSGESIAMVASSQNLSTIDAEVLATYVIGLYCPDVR
ncbi:MAG: hypothetical protein VKI81_03245 [Synechococcaceae cyanobacterium]|nr:hypothetical protein [Synechococcaceae cyanobacterium]